MENDFPSWQRPFDKGYAHDQHHPFQRSISTARPTDQKTTKESRPQPLAGR
jgi:hypothetical protein